MAITVVRASSQYAEATSAVLTSGAIATFTVAAWYKPSSISNGTVLSQGDSNSNEYIALGMDGAGAVFIEVTGANASTGTISNGTWAHLAGVQSSGTSRVAYKDGAVGSANTTVQTPGPLDRTTVGGLVLNASRLSFSGGDIAECAIWDVALTAAEVLSLSKGFSPLVVRPASLLFYAPLYGNSPERELRGRKELTYGAAGAAPTLATGGHVKVFGTGRLVTLGVPSAGGVDATVTAAPAVTAGALVPPPTVGGGTAVTSPAGLVLGSAPVATLSAGSVVATPAGTGLGAIPAPAVGASYTASAPAAVGLGSAATPAVDAASIVVSPAAASVGAMIAPAVSTGSLAIAAPAAATGTVTAPTLVNAVEALPGTVVGTAVVPTVAGLFEALAAAATALGSAPPPVATSAAVTSAVAATALGTFPPPGASGSGSAVVSALPGVIAGAGVAPSLAAGSVVTGAPATIAVSSSAQVSAGSTALSVAALALGSLAGPAVSAGAVVTSTTTSSATSTAVPSPAAGSTITSSAGLATATALMPIVLGSGTAGGVLAIPGVATTTFAVLSVGIPAVGWLEGAGMSISMLESSGGVSLTEGGLVVVGMVE